MDPFQAVRSNKYQKIERYIALEDVDINALDENGRSLLDHAMECKHEAMIELLRYKGALESKDIEGSTSEAVVETTNENAQLLTLSVAPRGSTRSRMRLPITRRKLNGRANSVKHRVQRSNR